MKLILFLNKLHSTLVILQLSTPKLAPNERGNIYERFNIKMLHIKDLKANDARIRSNIG